MWKIPVEKLVTSVVNHRIIAINGWNKQFTFCIGML